MKTDAAQPFFNNPRHTRQHPQQRLDRHDRRLSYVGKIRAITLDLARTLKLLAGLASAAGRCSPLGFKSLPLADLFG
jgi:hypothetical protein